MHNTIIWTLLVGSLLATASLITHATSPEEHLQAIREFHEKRYPKVEFQDFGNGAYALNEENRAQWLEIEEFPPYEMDIEHGEALFNTPFKNGKTYGECFENGGIGIKQNYPYFDLETGQVKTLELEINECREQNGEQPLRWKKGDIAAISAYMTSTSQGKPINVVVPDDPRAIAAYEAGKKFYHTKRGQLNFACADCHFYSGGMLLRTETLSPALGQTSHFPVYRSKWGELGTLHRRYGGCNSQVRAKPFKPQSEEYRNLEYYHTFMSNGIEINGPASRK